MITPSKHPASMYFPQSAPDGHLLASLIKTLMALVHLAGRSNRDALVVSIGIYFHVSTNT